MPVEFGASPAFRGWVRFRVLGYGFGVRGRKVKSRDCALASDLVRANKFTMHAWPVACLPGVVAHSMIIEICGAAALLLRRALSARGCRFAAAGQTTSGNCVQHL